MSDDTKEVGRVGITSDFTDPEILHQKLLETIRKYRPNTDLSSVEKAYELAKAAHGDQRRKQGAWQKYWWACVPPWLPLQQENRRLKA